MQLSVLNHVRWIAALLVAVSHIRNFLFVDFQAGSGIDLLIKAFYFISGFGHQAVVIFFVISGFLVGGKLLEIPASAKPVLKCRNFLIDRFARIFIVLWPAILLSLAVLGLVYLLVPHAPIVVAQGWSAAWSAPLAGDLNVLRWTALLIAVNEFLTTTPMINSPLWSLAFEWYYYIAGLAVALLAARQMRAARMGWVVAYAALLTGIALVGNTYILTAGASWVSGVIARHVYNRGYLPSPLSTVIAGAVFLAVFALARLRPLPDIAIALPLAILLAHTSLSRVSIADRFGQTMADFSFSLYAIHVPVSILLIALLQHAGFFQQRVPVTPGSFLGFLAIMLMVVAVARGFAYVTEDHTGTLRQWLRLSRQCADARALG